MGHKKDHYGLKQKMRKSISLLLFIFFIWESSYAPIIKTPRGMILNHGNPLSRGLVGLWLMNEGSGNKIYDLSRNGLNVTPTNGYAWTSGKYGSAVLLDDESDQMWSVDKAAVTVTPITIICWFNSDSITAGQVLVAIPDKDTYNQHFSLQASGNAAGDKVRVSIRDGGVQYYAESLTGYSANTWHQAIGLFVSSTERYAGIDGVLGTAETTDVTPSGMDRTAIGAYGHSSQTNWKPFSGMIDNVMIWNRVLSASEIAQLYREPFYMILPTINPMIYAGDVGAPPSTGQIIIIQMSMVPVFVIVIIIFSFRISENNESRNSTRLSSRL